MAKKVQPSPKRKPAAKNKWQTGAQNLQHKRSARFLFLWSIPFLVLMSSFFSEVLRNFNYLEILPRELIFPTFMHATTALVIALVVYFLKKPQNMGAKAVVVLLLGLLMVGYNSRLETVLPFLRAVLPLSPDQSGSSLLSLAFLGFLFAVALGVGRLFERFQPKYEYFRPYNVALGILIVVGFLFFGQAVRVVRILPAIDRQASVQPPLLPHDGVAGQKDKPDVYYLVFDRYASGKVLRDQLHFDNHEFTGFLEDNDFYVKDEAYSNYPYTSMSVASALSAQYLDGITAPYRREGVQSRMLYHNLIYQSSVVKAFQSQGYQYHSIGSNYSATERAPLAGGATDYATERVFEAAGQEKRIRGIEGLQLAQSPFYRFLQEGSLSWLGVTLKETVGTNYLKHQLDTLEYLAESKDQGGRFIFAHILLPHAPYAFNADGSFARAQKTDNEGKLAKDKYLGQLQFTSTQIKRAVELIRQKSNNEAVIILNSDEGPYPDVIFESFRNPVSLHASREQNIEGDMRQWSDEWLQTKFGILQAVHIPKATDEDLAHLSSANILRIVLNRYLGYNLDYLPDCHFGLTKGRHYEFQYTDVTGRLASSEQANRCAGN